MYDFDIENASAVQLYGSVVKGRVSKNINLRIRRNVVNDELVCDTM